MSEHESISTSGAPTITFHVNWDTIRAELAGAKLYAEACAQNAADLRITDATGFVLADLVVRERPERNLTENVMDIGSALLWSHWRYVQASNVSTNPNPSPPLDVKHSEACPYCDVGPGVDCAIHPAYGKLYSGCDRRMATKRSMAELIAASSIGEGLRDIEERGIDAHLADVEKGRF